MSEPADHDLIDQTLAGRAEAFDALVRRYQDRLVHSLEHALGSRDDALEAAQQAFVSAWKNLAGFRRDAAFYSWLYRIAFNAAKTARSRQRVRTTSLNQLHEYGQMPSDSNTATRPEQTATTEERIQLVQQAIRSIAEEYRQPLVLREIDGMSYDEIGLTLGIPVGTVRSRIFRARQELTDRLKRLFPDER
ncbi:MAG: sigma-70 family RNA polymerase sigma factor [Fuerstiella sp.]|nr:sigma-70 family RNA polymerase sigma factor [Fuerstiella sp.]